MPVDVVYDSHGLMHCSLLFPHRKRKEKEEFFRLFFPTDSSRQAKSSPTASNYATETAPRIYNIIMVSLLLLLAIVDPLDPLLIVWETRKKSNQRCTIVEQQEFLQPAASARIGAVLLAS